MRNHWSYPVAVVAAVTPTEALPSPAADAVMVEWLPSFALLFGAATVTCCGRFQSDGVKVSVWPLDTLTAVAPDRFSRTVTSWLGFVDSETLNVPVLPFETASVDWSVTTLGFSTWIATGSEVVVCPRLSVVTAVSE